METPKRLFLLLNGTRAQKTAVHSTQAQNEAVQSTQGPGGSPKYIHNSHFVIYMLKGMCVTRAFT